MTGITKLEDLLRLTEGYHQTSTIENLKPQSVTFVKDKIWLQKVAENESADCFTLIPSDLAQHHIGEYQRLKMRPIYVDRVSDMFVRYHNAVNAQLPPTANQIDDSVGIHNSAVVGVDGIRLVKTNNGPIRMKHMGNVVLKHGVEVGPFSTIHRATIDSTIIWSHVNVGSYCNVGHNVWIGAGSVLTVRVTIGGSTRIGKNCLFGMHAVVRDNITICDNVRIGMGAVVVKSIDEPGTYVGHPAKRVGDWDIFEW